MTFGTFVVVEMLLVCFLSFLIGFMIGANKGAKDTTKIWEEAYAKK